MKGLLGAAEDDNDEALSQMWEDGLAECVCPLGRITFDDFRMFIKGQKRDKEPGSPIQRRASRRLVLDANLLQAVPEGSMSPQAKHHVFAKFDEMSALESLKLPLMGMPPVPISSPSATGKAHADIGFPTDLPKPFVKRSRSRSLGETTSGSNLTHDQGETDQRASTKMLPRVILPSKSIGELRHVLADESITAREIHQALYRKHRQFRQSVIAASKLFDQKQRARKFESALASSERRPDLEKRASLVMKRGASPLLPQKGFSLEPKSEHVSGRHIPDIPEPPSPDMSPDFDQTRKVADASKRSGRPRRPREKTSSDISGMLR